MPSQTVHLYAPLQKQIDAGAVAGIVTLIATKEKVLDVHVFGKADISTAKAMTADALFWIASVTKPITGTLLMMLVDDGKVLLDDPIQKYIPAFQEQQQIVSKDGDLITLRPAAAPVTIRQAMTHTSGMGFFSRPEKTIDRYPLDQAAMSYAMSPLLFEPGSKYQYGNMGINTVGRIIEIVSGMSFSHYLSRRLLLPLGMSQTTFVPSNEQLGRLACGYRCNPDKTSIEPAPIEQLRYPLNDHTRCGSPAGGLFSTAADVTKFAQMILNGGEMHGHRFLSEKSLRTMTSTQTGGLHPHSGQGSGYGIGWETFAPETARVAGSVMPGQCGHGGALSNHMDINPHTGLINIFMVQQSGWINAEAENMRKQFNVDCSKYFT